MAAFTASMVVYIAKSELPKHAEDVAREQCPVALPSDAEHVSYIQGSRGYRFCEFSIDEKRFIDWVKTLQASYCDWQDGELERISSFHEVQDYPSHLSGSDTRKIISKGYICTWHRKYDYLTVIYDANEQRAYYQFSPD